MHEGANARNEDAFGPGWRRIEPFVRESLAEPLAEVIEDIRNACVRLGARAREEPAEIRMRQSLREPAVLASAARARVLGRSGTQQVLA